MDKETICDFSNLYKAYRKAKSGKKYNNGTAKFQNMSLEGLHILKEQLENQTYMVNPYNEFKIYEPKERVIKSCSFKDKVVQRCLCDEILLPRLEREFIDTNYAGQSGKGNMYAMNSLKSQMLKHYEKYGNSGWILKCDIRQFYYQVDHGKAEDVVDFYFEDPFVMWLNHLYIESTENIGLPLGNQTSGIYGLLFLNGLDHFITGELGIEFYGRYCDDFYLICNSKEYLKYCLYCIREFVLTLGLSLNGKTQIVPFSKGILFVGFHHYVTNEGKYIRKVSGKKKRDTKKKIRSWKEQVIKGYMTEEKFRQKFDSCKNHLSHGNCVKLCRSLDFYVKELEVGNEN